MKAVRPVIASNGVPSSQMRSGGSHCTSEREEKLKQERTVRSYIAVQLKDKNIYSLRSKSVVAFNKNYVHVCMQQIMDKKYYRHSLFTIP